MPGEPRPRWLLFVQAQFWRTLMQIGMVLHKMASPRPPSPNFTRSVTTTISPKKGKFNIQFYVPDDYFYETQNNGRTYPLVVNFHGGGFTLGSATDDARWARQVVEEVGAVVASVDYRRAPECPFPTAVEDGADAVLYLANHADDLGLDASRIAISGFSSGANMTFTVPLLLRQVARHAEFSASTSSIDTMLTKMPTDASSSTMLALREREGRVRQDVRLRGVVSWYPSTDYTHTREQRRATCPRHADQLLPAVFTELFDQSYLSPPTLDMANPFLSPGAAPSELLEDLPDHLVIYACEYDMLAAEAERLRDRLVLEAGKTVVYQLIKGVPHAWDKAPNPLREGEQSREKYHEACEQLKLMFDDAA